VRDLFFLLGLLQHKSMRAPIAPPYCFAAACARPSPPTGGPAHARPAPAPRGARLGAYAVPFLAADTSVVRRTAGALAAAGEPAYHAAARRTLPSRRALYTYLLFGSALLFLARRPWSRASPLRLPRLFNAGRLSHEGPPERQLAETSLSVTFSASGCARGEGAAPPPAPGDARALPSARGALGAGPGCAPPAALFRGAGLAERPRARGVASEEVRPLHAPRVPAAGRFGR
jgi:hypothetical protein